MCVCVWSALAAFAPAQVRLAEPGEQSRQIYLDDTLNGIGQTFLSTPLRCCKCHDHKFDPIPTRDYYRMYAALATTPVR